MNEIGASRRTRILLYLLSARVYPDGLPHPRCAYGDFVMTPDALYRLRTATRPLANLEPVSGGDESYDVMLYDGARALSAAPCTAPNPPLCRGHSRTGGV